ncbi:MAG: branched-chain amino acid ABC transporter permease [Candidatus Aerophobetes bacterium]|nr:branched-chain amino acid ABC transporter permease [Candidatus Aerophobetes bacterium]
MILQILVSGSMMGLIYALVAVGLTLIWGVMDIINFAHGDLMMLGMFVSYWAFVFFGIDPLASIPLSAIGLFLLGMLLYKLIIKRIIDAPLITALLATYGISLVLKNLALLFFGPDYRTIKNPLLEGSWRLGGLYVSVPKAIGAIISVLVIVLIYFFIKKSQTGRAIQAISMDRQAALLVGVDVGRLYTITFGIGAACTGVAGAILSNFFTISPESGSTYVLLSFVIVALGGFGSITGALSAGVLIGIAATLGGFYISPAFKFAIIFAAYLVVVMIRPEKGLFGW